MPRKAKLLQAAFQTASAGYAPGRSKTFPVGPWPSTAATRAKDAIEP
jgi:hypothetical protein